MDIDIKSINFIRWRDLSHRQFQALLSDMNDEHGDLIYYTVVWWISWDHMLNWFFDLPDDIKHFMGQKRVPKTELDDELILNDLAFHADVTEHLDQLNTRLQGAKQIVTHMYDHMLAFARRLVMFCSQLENLTSLTFLLCRSLVQLRQKLTFRPSLTCVKNSHDVSKIPHLHLMFLQSPSLFLLWVLMLLCKWNWLSSCETPQYNIIIVIITSSHFTQIISQWQDILSLSFMPKLCFAYSGVDICVRHSFKKWNLQKKQVLYICCCCLLASSIAKMWCLTSR